MQRIVLSLLLLLHGQKQVMSNSGSYFALSHIRMCLKPEFLHHPDVAAGSEIHCAFACNQHDSGCQGFWMPGGRCQIFEFDRCSHMVNVANCNQTAWAFVRKHENLPDGQLCPPGYGHNYLGSTYKIFDVTSWTDGQARCSSEPGLTKFADAMDRAESDHFHRLMPSVTSGSSYFVGGLLTGSWMWQACSSTILPELWMPGQPNVGGSYNRAGIWYSHAYGLDDLPDSYAVIDKALCECINPFV